MAVSDLVHAILTSPYFAPQITDHRLLPKKDAVSGSVRQPWSRPIAKLLESLGIALYDHQAIACNHIRAGHSVVVCTPTASGKTLIYSLPVLESCLTDPETHALYLFPLKALAQDQLHAFQKLTQSWPEAARPSAALYDGDTPDAQRKIIRKDPPNVVLTNPEMLHLALLPWHSNWSMFFANLRYIIVDEAHTYRGVFGSNMAYVFRRINRIIARYGGQPTYIIASATIGNPQELAKNLVDHEATVIAQSGAPQGIRHTIFINPSIHAPSTVAINLLSLALEHNLRTIVYCQSRKMTELISMWAQKQAPELTQAISSYRSGFLPEERRIIEAQMNEGSLRCVVSTSALELGIDIGDLDVCILVGYPGSIMATLQRAGRVGRASQDSLVILIAGEDALDQYIITNPNDFFARSPEKALINPDNPVICEKHILCAAQESPILPTEPWVQTDVSQKAIQNLLSENLLLWTKDGTHLHANATNPQRDISLRNVGQPISIETPTGDLIGSVDTYRLWRETHPGAVYLHRSQTYIVDDVQAASGRVIAHKDNVPWYTKVKAQKSTVILQELDRKSLGACCVMYGKLRITDQVIGYERRSNSGNNLLAYHPLDAPPQIFETEGLWYVIPEQIRTMLEEEFIHFMGSIHAMEHAIIGLLPLRVLADRNDFGGISIPLHPQVGESCVFVYDGVPYGCGLTREAFKVAREMLVDTLQTIRHCSCSDGCPSCVHSPKCGSGNRPISKSGAIRLLSELLAPSSLGDHLVSQLTIDPPHTPPNPKHPSSPPTETQSPKANKQAPKEAIPIAPPANYIVFDVETRRSSKEVGGWNHPDKMGVSVCIAYHSTSDTFHRFLQDDIPDLITLFRQADCVVGFNSLHFDYRVLAPFSSFDLAALPTVDILARLQQSLHYRVSLNNIAQATLGASKSADGLMALSWWKEGNIEAIAKYCTDDVRITRDLYLFGLQNGYLAFTAKSGHMVRVPVHLGL
ncbi:MAG: DEAD/DEAH box helicase [Desulfovibrio sp.]|nr:DEAD/DEAH box helicase [Desulfovibrio sp.]